jgi:hypothetical protein
MDLIFRTINRTLFFLIFDLSGVHNTFFLKSHVYDPDKSHKSRLFDCFINFAAYENAK